VARRPLTPSRISAARKSVMPSVRPLPERPPPAGGWSYPGSAADDGARNGAGPMGFSGREGPEGLHPALGRLARTYHGTSRRTWVKRRGRARPAVAVLGRGKRHGKCRACGGRGLEGTLGPLSPLCRAPLKQPARHGWIAGPYALFWVAFLGALSEAPLL